ncbi:MAG: hypothetical protein WCI05_06600 [Myxococcales bacterium]
MSRMPPSSFAAEVDLLAQELRIAVEIDGYYHFQGQAPYRRDRRKDFELQHRGYLVQLHTAVLWRQKQRLKANHRGGEP